jgi:hypothetical protein
MQRQSLLALVAAALVLTGLAALILSHGDRAVSRATGGERALPVLADKLDQVTRLRLTRGAMNLHFQRADRRWTLVEKGNYPADHARIRQLLLQLAALELVEKKTDRRELLARLELDDPANGTAMLVAAQGQGVDAQLVIGRRRPSEIGQGEAGVYVRRPDSDQAWLARGSFSFAGDAISWLDRRVIDIAPGRVASVVLTAPDGDAVTLVRGSADQPFAIDGLPEDARPKPDAALAAPAGALAALDLVDVKPAAESAAEESNSTAAFTTFDGLVIGLRLPPPERGDWLAIDVTGAGGAEADAKLLSERLAHWRFAIAPERAKLLRTTLPDLLLPRGS